MGYPTAYRQSLVNAFQTLEQARIAIDGLKTSPGMRHMVSRDPDEPTAVTVQGLEEDLTILRDWVYSQMGAA